MITLPHVTPQNPVDKPGAPEGQVSDGESVTEDFSQLVRTAKAGLTLGSEETVLRKVAVKKDSLNLVAELATGKVTAEPQDTLTALLAPQGKNTAVTKALLTASEKTDQESDSDLQAISALLAMLPRQEQAISLEPALAGKTPAVHKGLEFASTTNLHSTAKPALDTDNSRPTSTENAVGRFAQAEQQVSLRVADNQTPLSPSISSSSAPILSTGVPLTTPATPILNSQLGSQEWQQQLSQQIVLFTRQGQQHAELRLHPEHLGKVEISLKLDDNQLQLQIMSPHSHVRAALEAALPMLRTSLSESGVQLSQSQVGGEGSMQQQQHADQREQQAARQNGTFSLEQQNDEETTLAVSDALQRLVQNKGAVDTFA